MRLSTLPLVLAGIAFAQDAPKERTFKEGKLTDPYWGLSYTAPGLEQGMGIGGGGKLFEGRCTGGVEIEILVQEADKELSSAEWKTGAKEQWAKKRKMQDLEETETTILFMEESLAGFKRHHGYGFFARGPQAFLVHATVNEKSETSGEAIKAALTGLTLDPQAKPALLVYVISKQQAVSPDDPRVLFTAGQWYFHGNEQQRVAKNLVLAERVLDQAIREAKQETYGPDELWLLHENLGLATLEERKLDVAIGWLTKSEQLAEKATAAAPGARSGQSSYNLACAYALAGKTDEAFAALDRCIAKGFLKVPDNVSHMKTGDPDLESLRKDPRWEALFNPAEKE
jgi:hypothetical protein